MGSAIVEGAVEGGGQVEEAEMAQQKQHKDNPAHEGAPPVALPGEQCRRDGVDGVKPCQPLDGEVSRCQQIAEKGECHSGEGAKDYDGGHPPGYAVGCWVGIFHHQVKVSGLFAFVAVGADCLAYAVAQREAGLETEIALGFRDVGIPVALFHNLEFVAVEGGGLGPEMADFLRGV